MQLAEALGADSTRMRPVMRRLIDERKFETKGDTFAGYDVHTPELETEDGFKVGDTDVELEERYGDDLAGSPLGVHAFVLSASKPGRSSVSRVSATGARMCTRMPYFFPSIERQREKPKMPALAAP